MLLHNTGARGCLDTDAFQRAMLQYRNTPARWTKLSPAQCLFGRKIRDFIPIPPYQYEPHPVWKDTLRAREEALRVRHHKISERLSEHTKHLPLLKVGDTVRLQNQFGQYPKRWNRSGTIIEVRQFDQYVVRVDGSGRVILRNRKFLRKYIPVFRRPTASVDTSNLPRPEFEHADRSVQDDQPSITPPTPDLNHVERLAQREQTVTPPPTSQLEQSNPTQRPAEPSRRASIPLALSRLKSFNAPGLKEDTGVVLTRTRSGRQY